MLNQDGMLPVNSVEEPKKKSLFGRLFYYDFSGILAIVLIGIIVAFGITALSVGMTYAVDAVEALKLDEQSTWTSVLYVTAELVMILSSLGMYIVMSVFPWMVIVITCIHFGKGMFGSRGYLAFTLPVKAKSVLYSKLLCGVIYTIVAALVPTSCVILFLAFGKGSNPIFGSIDFISTVKSFFSEPAVAIAILLLLSTLLFLVYFVVVWVITFVNLRMSRRRPLWIILFLVGAYYGYYFTFLLLFIIFFAIAMENDALGVLTGFLYGLSGVNLLGICIAIDRMRNLVTKHLNLQ